MAPTEIYRGAEYTPKLPAEYQVKWRSRPIRSNKTTRFYHRGGETRGIIGDGKIFVLDLESAVRIRHRRNRRAAI